MDKDSIQKTMDDMFSPCDQILVDLAGGLIEDLGMVKDVIADRNCKEVTGCFVIGLISTVARRLTNVNINVEDMKDFLVGQYKKNSTDFDLGDE